MQKFIQIPISHPACSQTRRTFCNVNSVWVSLCSLVNSQKREMSERYSSPFNTMVFSFTKNEQLLAAGSTGLMLPLLRVNRPFVK